PARVPCPTLFRSRLARRRAPPARARAARAGRDRRPLARRRRAPAPRLRVGLRREPARALLLRQEAAARLGGRLARVLLGGRRGPRRAVEPVRAAHARRGAALSRPAVRAGRAGRALLAQTYWLVQVPGLLALLAPAAAVVAGAGVLAALAALGRRPDWLVAALAASMVPLAAVVLRAEGVAEPLFSWRPVARALVAAVPREVEVVFEAPEEYQQVGG